MDYGLIGGFLGYSYSKDIHGLMGLDGYGYFVVPPEKLGDFVKSTSLKGFNVTAPHKKKIIKYLDELSPLAQRIGAVNTVVKRDGRLYGYNTDYYGLLYTIVKNGVEVGGKKVVVLGSGGTSQTARCVLSDLGAVSVDVVSRKGALNYENCYDLPETQIVVNTTPVGTYPATDERPVDLKKFPNVEAVVDVVYNPTVTKLMFQAKEMNLRCGGGLDMLIAQALKAEEIFLSKTLDEGLIEDVRKKLVGRIKNIVLIGMPGSGKTTLARMIAKEKNMAIIDTDEEICKEYGMTVPQIFEKFSEAEFRRAERRVIEKFGKEKGLVIATGGGAVTNKENKFLLWQNGTVYYIDRDTDLLDTVGRPLSAGGRVGDLYRERLPLYEDFAHTKIENKDLDEALKEILSYEDTCYQRTES